MYITPSPHKCIKCGHEFMFSPSDFNLIPMTQHNRPVCPKCWDTFLATIGLGYCTTAWFKDGSDYEQKMRE